MKCASSFSISNNESNDDLHLEKDIHTRYNLEKLDPLDQTYTQRILYDDVNRGLFRKIDKEELTGFFWWIHPNPSAPSSLLVPSAKWKDGRILTQKEIQKRWKGAFEKWKGDPFDWSILELKATSLFLPNIGAGSCRHSEIRLAMQILSKSINDQWKSENNGSFSFSSSSSSSSKNEQKNEPAKDILLDWDEYLTYPVSGFGTEAVQYYVKSGLTVTLLHDELAWSAALNYMKRSSCGVALWIGFNLNELASLYSTEELVSFLNEKQVPILLENLYTNRERIPSLIYAWQHPGDLISSPHTRGSCHIVITIGSLVEQIAWNVHTTLRGIRNCIEFWGGQERVDYNSGLATLNVLPLLQLQYLHSEYDFGPTVKSELRKIKKKLHPTLVEDCLATTLQFCSSCSKQCLFIKTKDKDLCERCI